MRKTYRMLGLLLSTAITMPGASIPVATSAAFQAALNSAVAGDVIVLTAGITYTGNFTLPNRGPLTGYITIQSSMVGSLPTGAYTPRRQSLHARNCYPEQRLRGR